jgi:hypothetical protein
MTWALSWAARWSTAPIWPAIWPEVAAAASEAALLFTSPREIMFWVVAPWAAGRVARMFPLAVLAPVLICSRIRSSRALARFLALRPESMLAIPPPAWMAARPPIIQGAAAPMKLSPPPAGSASGLGLVPYIIAALLAMVSRS